MEVLISNTYICTIENISEESAQDANGGEKEQLTVPITLATYIRFNTFLMLSQTLDSALLRKGRKTRLKENSCWNLKLQLFFKSKCRLNIFTLKTFSLN